MHARENSACKVKKEGLYYVTLSKYFYRRSFTQTEKGKFRVAGNVIDDNQLGSVEYAADHLGCNLVVVLGHTHCGAVGAAIGGGAEGFIKSITDEIMAAIGSEKDDYKACCLNVENSVKKIEKNLNVSGLKAMGAIYHIEDGHVEFQ